MTIILKKANWDLFHEAFSRVNRKLEKYDTQVEIESTEPARREVTDEFTGRKWWVEEVVVQLKDPNCFGKRGVEYIGAISFKDGIRSIYNTDPSVVLAEEPLRCDHCHTERYRSIYYAFREGDEVRLIGSSCAEEWFGLDIERILNVMDPILRWRDTEPTGWGGNRLPLMSTIIGLTHYETDMCEQWWVSKEKADGVRTFSTTGQINATLSAFYIPGEIGRKVRDAFRHWCRDLPDDWMEEQRRILREAWVELEPSNDFEYNVAEHLFTEDEHGTRVLRDYVRSAGIVGYSVWKANHDIRARAEEKTDKPISEWQGEIGKRLDFRVCVETLKWIDNDFGGCDLILFVDEAGNRYKTFYSGADRYEEKQWYRIRGTVKKHEDWQGRVKTTVLTRCAVKEKQEE